MYKKATYWFVALFLSVFLSQQVQADERVTKASSAAPKACAADDWRYSCRIEGINISAIT